jgi:hypothetical protein
MISQTPAFRPAEFDGVWLIKLVHDTALELGYERVRADRGQDPRTGRYYEVGYGPLFSVTLKTSLGEVLIMTKEAWGSVSKGKIAQFLIRNLAVVA